MESFFRYSEEQCKVVLLFSALLMVPLRDIVTACLYPYVPLVVAKGVGYVFWGTIFFLFFLVPFLCRISLKKDMVLFGVVIFSGLLFFGIRRPEEISHVYVLLLAKSMFMAFPYYVIARHLKDYDLLENALYSVSFLINLLVFLSMWHRVEIDGIYSMGAAYAVLPGAIIAFRMLFRRFSFLSILNAGLALFALAFCGTRGPMVCYLMFCCYEMLFNRSMMRKKVVKKILIGGMVLLFLVAGIDVAVNGPLLGYVKEYVATHRIRLFIVAKEGDFFRDESRERIRRVAWETIEEHPFWGVGVLEDRVQIFKRGEFAAKADCGYEGFYSHFAFLDWLLEYGIIVGGVISLIVVVCVLKIIAMSPCSQKSCLEIFIFAGCAPLLFSGIWHESRMFCIFLGMAVSVFENYHRTKVEMLR